MSINDIVPFSGIISSKSISAGRWITQIEIVCSLIEGVNKEPSVRFFLHLLNSKLIGIAAEWADENPAIQGILRKVDPGLDDRRHFCQMFVERFTPEKTDVVEEFDRLQQMEDESLYDYYRRVEILAFRAGAMDDKPYWKELGGSLRFVRKQIIFRFIVGLRDEDLSRELLRATKVKSLNKIYELARELQMMNRIIAKRFPPQRTQQSRTPSIVEPGFPEKWTFFREESEKSTGRMTHQQPSPISTSPSIKPFSKNFEDMQSAARSVKSFDLSKSSREGETPLEPPHQAPTAEPTPSESPEWKISLPVRTNGNAVFPEDPFAASPSKNSTSPSSLRETKKTPHRRIDFVKEKKSFKSSAASMRPIRPGNPSPSRASRFAIKKSVDSKEVKVSKM